MNKLFITFSNGWWFYVHFDAVKNLFLPGKSTEDVMRTLQAVAELGLRGVLSKLENIFLDSSEVSEQVRIAIGIFYAVRRDTGYPVTVFISDGDWDGNRFTKV